MKNAVGECRITVSVRHQKETQSTPRLAPPPRLYWDEPTAVSRAHVQEVAQTAAPPVASSGLPAATLTFQSPACCGFYVFMQKQSCLMGEA